MDKEVEPIRLDITPDLFELDASKPDIDLFYFAGLFDGEGCVSISSGKRAGSQHRSHALCAAVHMGDREPLDALYERWGGGVYPATQNHERNRDTWRWAVWSRKAGSFLADLRPYLRIERVIRKVDLALEFQAQKGGVVGKGGMAAYRERQHAYFEQMRELNRRGPERQAA